MLKPVVKSAFRTTAALLGPHRWRKGPTLLVLTYHRVLPHDHPGREAEEPGMLVTPEQLGMHFDVLRKYFKPVHLDAWMRAANHGEPIAGRSVAVTFDDGWRDNFDYGLAVIKAAEMPATVFLVADLVGTQYRFWPNRLASVLKAWTPSYAETLDRSTREELLSLGVPVHLDGHSISPDMIDDIVSRCKVAKDSAMHELVSKIEHVLPEAHAPLREGVRDLMNWDEIKEMSQCGLVKFGSHTRSHTRLRQDIPRDKLVDEIIDSRRVLEESLAQSVDLFCYPSGDTCVEADRLVRQTYFGAVSTSRGWNSISTDRYGYRRIGIHGDVTRTPSEFLGRISAWFRL